MSRAAIKVEGLSKRYRIEGLKNPYRTFREALVEAFFRPLRSREDGNTIWALKDISFEVQPGEVVGIIGRNGAGKSTLLKILSRITEPTDGWAEIRGRVGSLLEVGTGFHPELTGRENIFLNGAILGMKRQEIRKNFDPIVSFAELEKFIDTPVKRYSSGMYMRLAFSVAAHLEPEILLVDEVLAVGDAGFQKKCLGKMGEVAKQGRTVFFVSHNMGAVTTLCTRGILLERGTTVMDGSASAVVNRYMEGVAENSGSTYRREGPPASRACLESADVQTVEGESCGTFLMTQPLAVECVLCISEPSAYTLSLLVKEMNNSPVCHFPNRDSSYALPSDPGRYRIRVKVPALNLYPGKYLIQLTLCETAGVHFEEIEAVEALSFDVQQDFAVCDRPLGRHGGIFYANAEWSDQRIETDVKICSGTENYHA